MYGGFFFFSKMYKTYSLYANFFFQTYSLNANTFSKYKNLFLLDRMVENAFNFPYFGFFCLLIPINSHSNYTQTYSLKFSFVNVRHSPSNHSSDCKHYLFICLVRALIHFSKKKHSWNKIQEPFSTTKQWTKTWQYQTLPLANFKHLGSSRVSSILEQIFFLFFVLWTLPSFSHCSFETTWHPKLSLLGEVGRQPNIRSTSSWFYFCSGVGNGHGDLCSGVILRKLKTAHF